MTDTTVIPTPRRRRRVFMWVFLVIQALFILWIITGLASHGPDTGAQASQLCSGHGWYPLYKSYADCIAGGSKLLSGASDIGKGLGVTLIIAAWVIIDFLLAVTWLVVRLSRRP